MRKIIALILAFCLLGVLGGCFYSPEENEEEIMFEEEFNEPIPEIVYSGSVDVYSISGESFLRSGEKVGDISELEEDEFYTYALHLQYNGPDALSWEEAYVCVDGGENWNWVAGSVPSGSSCDFHIYNCNMEKLSLGSHTVSWYFDGQEVFSDTFMLTEDLNWAQLTSLPSEDAIASFQNTQNLRSPYMPLWFEMPNDVRYTEYSVDFKADYLPIGTYCALGNWYMDYSSLEAEYIKVDARGISAYAGVQNIHNSDKMAIMSFWDVYCTDHSGNESTIRAKIVYPEAPAVGREFDNEGVGAQCIDHYQWEENHWYRMHLKCCEGESGTTYVEYWLTDLESGEKTLVCIYDTCVKDSAFKGSICVFLENYITEYAADIRTLEVCNAKYLDEASGNWVDITGGTMYPCTDAIGLDYTGSFDYGASNGRLWIMTTGVGNTQNDSKGPYVNWG